MQLDRRQSDRQITRRQVLKRSMAAAAYLGIPLVVPASVRGADAPGERLGVGVVGMGSQGVENLKAFRARTGTQIVAVCDVDRGRMTQACRMANLRKEAGYVDFRELVARDDIDIVAVCTSDHWHVLVSLAAVRAGKDVYCEKPLCYNVSEGRALCNEVRRLNRVLQTGSQQRSDSQFRFACELVRNGYIGKLQRIDVELPENSRPNPLTWKIGAPPKELEYDLWLGPAPYRPYIEQGCHYNWHFLYDFGSGQITNWGAHMLDIAQWGNGSDMSGPVEISGRAEFPEEGLFETALKYDIEYIYENGVRLHCGTCTPGGRETGVRFEGTDGWLFVSRDRLLASPESLLQVRLGPRDQRLYYSSDHHQDFIRCVRNRNRPVADVEIGHRTATVCHIGDIAARLGRKLKWDPQQERFAGDDEANKMLLRPMRQPWRL